MMDNNERFNCKSPDDDIVCKTCKFKIGKTEFSDDYHKISCQKFEWPKVKPISILTEGDDCEEYEKEE